MFTLNKGIGSSKTLKIDEETMYRIPDGKNLHATRAMRKGG
jgi:hypothetical protein